MNIKVVEGKLFRDTEAIGKMDPFVEIQYIEKKYRTTVLEEGGKNPVWNQSFDIQIENSNDNIKITCFDEDPLTNDLIGETTLTADELIYNTD